MVNEAARCRRLHTSHVTTKAPEHGQDHRNHMEKTLYERSDL